MSPIQSLKNVSFFLPPYCRWIVFFCLFFSYCFCIYCNKFLTITWYYILIYVLTKWPKTNITEVDILCLNKMPDILQWISNAFIIRKSFVNTLKLYWSLFLRLQAPVPLTIFRSNSKFDQNVNSCNSKYTKPITTTFCTRDNSVTVVTCA